MMHLIWLTQIRHCDKSIQMSAEILPVIGGPLRTKHVFCCIFIIDIVFIFSVLKEGFTTG